MANKSNAGIAMDKFVIASFADFAVSFAVESESLETDVSKYIKYLRSEENLSGGELIELLETVDAVEDMLKEVVAKANVIGKTSMSIAERLGVANTGKRKTIEESQLQVEKALNKVKEAGQQ